MTQEKENEIKSARPRVRLDCKAPRVQRALTALDCWAVMQLAAGNPSTPTKDFILGVRREMVVSGMAVDLTPACTASFLTGARQDGLTVSRILADRGVFFERLVCVYHPREGNYSLYDGDEISLERQLLRGVVVEMGDRLGADLLGSKRVSTAVYRLMRACYESVVLDLVAAL